MKETVDDVRKTHIETDVLIHSELVPFIKLYLNKNNLYSTIYKFSNIVCIAWLVYYMFFSNIIKVYSVGERFSYLSYGIALTFLLLPVHELLHALAYKLVGAKKTGFKANLKKFYFMAVADQFVANRKEFTLVALTPFTVITASLITTAILVPDIWRLSTIATLMAHTAMCSGDFGLLSYFEFNKDKELVTYDDNKDGKSYFLEKVNAFNHHTI